MSVEVKISNLKGIKSLLFQVPLKGAFVVTGANGCGKTSLLTVLHRMGSRNAFQTGLPSGLNTSGVDGIQEASIQYDINGKSVVYKYNNTRWSASPKSNSKLIEKAFSEVLFLKADSSRVEPTQNELKGVKKQQADARLRNFMNIVFDSTRFNNLYRVILRGRNLTAHLIENSALPDRKKTYYSEKAFSLGELCVMRLGQKLLDMRSGGLYIIDEFEMALHPAAQIRLFKEIHKMADAANCTALMSTHSSSLIKSVRRSNIIYLEKEENGNVAVHHNVYPTYALQHLSLDEESAPDKLIFVEDVSAKSCLDAMWQEYIKVRLAKGNGPLPTVQIIVVGGYKEVLRFLERSGAFVPDMTRRMAALDADAKSICMPPSAGAARTVAKLSVPQSLYESQKNNVVFLPWTPEVGLCDLIQADVNKHTKGLQSHTSCMGLTISQALVNKHVDKTGKKQRDECKDTIDCLADMISKKMGWSQDRAKESLFSYLVKEAFLEKESVMKEICGKLFS